jgi:hypothetical protein
LQEISAESLGIEKPEVSENKRVPLPDDANKFRREFSLKIRRGTAIRKDYDKCKNGLERLELSEHKQPFYLLLALYHRIIDREPVKSLEILAPLVVPNDVAEKWVTEQREAQRKHLTEESLLEAIWMYLDVIKNYPNTLSAEASECYVIKILTLFSNPAFVKEASKRYGIILDELEDAKAHLRQAKRTAMAQPFLVGLEAYVERLKFVVKMWESTPFGRKALQQAEERAEKFLEKNKYGLYRGEVLLDIGTSHLVSFFDIENGEKWLNRAAEWFDNVQQFDKDLKDFELPESVRKISQPPKEERYKDRWTNTKLSQPKPGQFFNRRSCSWYWNSKRKDVTILQGLVAFAKEDYETAEKHWNLLAELDKEFYAQQKASGWENATTLARLTWNLRNQKGSLYATPEEMASFKAPKRRMAILLADLYYESEQHQKALLIYQRLENRELGTLSKNELAYVIRGTFACLCWNTTIDEITYLLPRAKLIVGTPSEAFAIIGFAGRIAQRGTLEANMLSIHNFEICLNRFPHTHIANDARFSLIERYITLANSAVLENQSEMVQLFYQKAYDHCIEGLSSQEASSYHKSLEKIKKHIEIVTKSKLRQK